MINNRQAGRRRGRGNNNGGGGNPRQGGGGQGRDNGNRIDSRARGNAAQLHEKYKNLARDAQMSGDRVNIEYYLQFADHYFRVLSEQRSRFEDNQPRRLPSNDAFDDGYDSDGEDDYGAEGDPIRAGEQAGEPRYERSEGQRNDRNDGQRGDGQRRDYQGQGQGRNGPRQDGQQRGDGQRQDGDRQDIQRHDSQRGDGQQRYDGQRSEQPRGPYRDDTERLPREDRDQPVMQADRQPRGERPLRADRQRGGQYDESALPVQVAQDAVVAPEEAAPRRRGRPRRDVVAATESSDAPGVFEADRLPPALSTAPFASNPIASNDVGEDAPKPRRRRTPRTDSSEVTAAE